MAIKLTITQAGILEWAQYLEETPRLTRRATARAINDYGAGVADGTAEAIAERGGGLMPSEVRALIDIVEATPERLIWEMDASAVAPPPQDWQRPWESRDTSTFDKQTLVKIVTVGDELTCEACEEAEENSPYTMAEIDELAARWKHFQPPAGVGGERTNLIHPNCRCILQPWASPKRVSVSFGGKSAPAELLSARQLGAKIADEIKVSIKVRK